MKLFETSYNDIQLGKRTYKEHLKVLAMKIDLQEKQENQQRRNFTREKVEVEGEKFGCEKNSKEK